MTGEPTHTASKEMIVPEIMFSFECTPQLSSTASKVQWSFLFTFSYMQSVTQRYRRKTVEEVTLQQSSHHQNTTIRAPYLSITASKVQWPLRFTINYVQPVTQHYKQRTVLESSLQSVHSPRKIRMIPIHKRTVGKLCITLP